MADPESVRARADAFCRRFGLDKPIVLAPMAGACPPALTIAVGQAGAMGGCGALLMKPGDLLQWVEQVRAATSAPFTINLWTPDPDPHRDPVAEAATRAFLAEWGPPVPDGAGDVTPIAFADQFAAVLETRPAVFSTIMGVLAPGQAAALRDRSIAWFATVTTPDEAKRAAAAGADALIVQGAEAGGHRGAFEADRAEAQAVGLFALVPAVRAAVDLPLVAAGGIADGTTLAAALVLGASAVQVGTAFLRTPEAGIAAPWADALAAAGPTETMLTRAFSGRAGRSLATAYAKAAGSASAPPPAPYPVQRGLTATMRAAAARDGRLDAMQAWAGQAAWQAQARPAGELVAELWEGARDLIR